VSKGLATRVTQEVTERVAKGTLDTLTKYLPEAIAARVAAQIAAREATEQTVSLATREVAKEVVALPVNALNILQMFGLVLDMLDVRGFQTQMTQDVITYLGNSMYSSVNTSADAAENLFQMPFPVYPKDTVEFKRQLKTKAMQAQVESDAAEYLSRLKVNSNGQTIVPLFASLAGVEEDALHKKYKVYWSMSGHNDAVFHRLVSYGWVIWLLLSLLIAAIVLICVFTNDTVQRKLAKR
jgi:hypothetical protein